MLKGGAPDEAKSGLDGATSPRTSLTRVVAGIPVCCPHKGSTYLRFYWSDHSAGAPGKGTNTRMDNNTAEPISVVHPRCCGIDVHVRLVPSKRVRRVPGDEGVKEVSLSFL